MFRPETIVASCVHPDGSTTYVIRSSSMSYFSPKGRARLAVKVTYSVYANMREGSTDDGALSQHGFKSKAAALRYFKQLQGALLHLATKGA